MNLNTYEVIINGKRSKEKAESINALINNFNLMGYDNGDIKVLRQIGNTSTNTKLPPPPAPTDQPVQTLSVDDLDVSPEMKKSIEKTLSENETKQSKPQPKPKSVVPPTLPKQTPPTKWKDGSAEYKLDGGKLFKKEWQKTTLSKLEKNGIRIKLKNQNNEKLKNGEIIVEVLEWVQMEKQ